MSRYRKPSKRPAAGKTILCLSALVLAAAIGGAHAAAAETEPTEGREQIIHKEALYAAECIVEEAEKITGVIAEAAADPYRDRPDIDPDDWMYMYSENNLNAKWDKRKIKEEFYGIERQNRLHIQLTS